MTIKYLISPPSKDDPAWHIAAIEHTAIFGPRLLDLETCPTEELANQWAEWADQYRPWKDPAGVYTFVPVALYELVHGSGHYYDTAMRILRERKQEGTLT